MARLCDRLAHVAGIGHRELVGVLLHEVGEPMHELLALLVPHAWPRARVEGLARGRDRPICV